MVLKTTEVLQRGPLIRYYPDEKWGAIFDQAAGQLEIWKKEGDIWSPLWTESIDPMDQMLWNQSNLTLLELSSRVILEHSPACGCCGLRQPKEVPLDVVQKKGAQGKRWVLTRYGPRCAWPGCLVDVPEVKVETCEQCLQSLIKSRNNPGLNTETGWLCPACEEMQ